MERNIRILIPRVSLSGVKKRSRYSLPYTYHMYLLDHSLDAAHSVNGTNRRVYDMGRPISLDNFIFYLLTWDRAKFSK